MAQAISTELGAPITLRPARTGRAPPDDDGRLLRCRGRLPVAGDSARLLRLRPPHPARAGRCGRRDRAVEHAAVPDRHQAGARAARRLLRRAQTGTRVPTRRAAARRHARARSGCRRAWSACSPATEKSARISSPTLASTRCRSPARRRRDGGSPQACGAELKRVSLELGGKSAAIVLDDADPAAVATGIRSASLSNSGQICNALTRILVPANRSDEFVDALAAEMASIVVGDPADPSHPDGSAGRAAPAAAGPRLHRHRPARRRTTGPRRDRTCPTASSVGGTSDRRCSPTPTTP